MPKRKHNRAPVFTPQDAFASSLWLRKGIAFVFPLTTDRGDAFMVYEGGSFRPISGPFSTRSDAEAVIYADL